MTLVPEEPRLLPVGLQAEAAFVRRLARSLVDEHTAEDLTQETLTRAWNQGPRGAGLRGWLATTLRRSAATFARRRGARVGREGQVARPEAVEENGVERAEVLSSVTQAVLRLEEPYRSVVLGRYYEERSCEELARSEGISASAVRSRLARGLARLRSELDRRHDREDWRLALVPLIGRGSTALSLAAGGFIVTKKVLLACLALIGLVWVGLESRGRDPRANEVTPVEEATGRLVPLEAAESKAERRTSEGGVLAGMEAPTALGSATTGTLSLQVLTSSGEPATGMPVQIVASGAPPHARMSWNDCDDEGRVEVELAPGTVRVHPLHGEEAAAEIQPGERTELRLELPSGFRVEGRVVDESGLPVPRAALFLGGVRRIDEGAVIAYAELDGTFVLSDLPPSRFLSASAPGFLAATVEGVPEPLPGEVATIEFVLPSSSDRFVGTVLDAEGLAATGALVLIEPQMREKELDYGTTSGWVPRRRLTTDEGGTFEVTGLGTGFVVRVLHEGHGELRRELPAQRTADHETFRLARPASVSGRVLDPEGEPLEGVTLTLDRKILGPPVLHDPDFLRFSWTRSDGDGRFRLDHLPAGEWLLLAQAESGDRVRQALLLVAGEVTEWNPRLEAVRRVRGRVSFADGTPAAGWGLRAIASELVHKSSEARHATTDLQGDFVLVDVSVGELIVSLYPPGSDELQPVQDRMLEATDREADFTVTQDLIASARIVGEAVDSRGTPVRANLSAWREGGRGALGRPLVHGRIDSGSLVPGKYNVTLHLASGRRFPVGTFELAIDEEHDLGTLVIGDPGTVVAHVEGSGLHHALIELEALPDIHARGSTDGMGIRHHMTAGQSEEVLPGAYIARLRGPGLAPMLVTIQVESGRETQVNLEARPGLRFEFVPSLPPDAIPTPEPVILTVRNEDDRELSRIPWFPNAPERNPPTRFWLAPGEYVLEARVPGRSTSRHPFRVDEAEGARSLAIQLP